jgi:hypothetical protein
MEKSTEINHETRKWENFNRQFRIEKHIKTKRNWKFRIEKPIKTKRNWIFKFTSFIIWLQTYQYHLSSKNCFFLKKENRQSINLTCSTTDCVKIDNILEYDNSIWCDCVSSTPMLWFCFEFKEKHIFPLSYLIRGADIQFLRG